MDRILFDPWPGTATEADLLRLVERDKRLCELIDGTLVEKPVGWADANDAGFVSGPDSTLRMTSGRVRLPDVAYVSRDRLPGGLVPRERVPTLAPDLAVEVLSGSNTADEIDQKLREYFQSGTRLAWVVDPRTRTTAVYHRPGDPTRVLDPTDRFDGEHVLPGFTLPVEELFRNVPPAL